MRRWFFVLLLVLMPLQFSWAALATYCEHESGAQAQHLGHHEHEHEKEHQKEHQHPQHPEAVNDAPDDTTKAKPSAVFDVHDCHSHCQCMADLPLSSTTPWTRSSGHATEWTGLRELAHVLSPPERPQWVDHA